MGMSFRNKIILMVLLIVAVFFASIIWAWHAYIKPEYLRTKAERILASSLDMPVSIESMRAKIFPSFVLSASHVKIGSPDTLVFGAKEAIVRISTWRLLLGQVRIKGIGLDQPNITIRRWDALKKIKIGLPRKGTGLPRFKVARGEINGFIKGRPLKIRDINGYVRHKGIYLVGVISGSNFTIKGSLEKPRWRYSLVIDSIDLGEFFSKALGIANLKLKGEFAGNAISMSVNADVSSLEFIYPSRHVRFGDVTLAADFRGDMNSLLVTPIVFKSKVIDLNGHARLNRPNDLRNASLEFDIHSSEFDYDRFVDYLPTEYLPSWLSKLLMSNIRHGKSKFSHIRYSGPLEGLKDPRQLLSSLYVEEKLDGQWFSEGYTNDVVKNITGSFVLKGGDAIFENLTGYMGRSKINKVDVRFLDIARKGLRLEIGVDINDMDLADFFPAWRAIVMPASLNRLFASASNVSKGRVSGSVRVRWDKLSGRSASVSGNVFLDDCSFSLGGISLKGLTLRAVSKDFSSPVLVDLRGIVNELPVDSLKMSISDLFGERAYTYTLKSHSLSVSDVFQAKDHLLVIISGKGKGPELSGNIRVSSKGFTLFGTHYRYTKGLLHGRGKIKGKLYNGFRLDIKRLQIPVGRQKLALDVSIGGVGNSLAIKGPLDLNYMEAFAGDHYHRLKGLVDGSVLVRWKKKTKPYLKGKLRLVDALVYHGATPVECNGYVLMDGKRLRSTMLSLTLNGINFRLSGRLDMLKRPYFKGNIGIENLKLNSGESQAKNGMLDQIDGDAHLDLGNIVVLGIPFSEGEAHARLDHGRLILKGMHLSGLKGNVKGGAVLSSGKAEELDFYLSLKGVDMKDLFAAITGGAARIEGSMDLIGHIWGKVDSINGTLAFYALDGRILRFNLLSKLFGVLNIYKILKTRTLDVFEHGFPYNYISSTFTIKDGIAYFDDFRLDSNSLQFSAVGRYILGKKYIDASLGVQPLETFDKVISVIPIVGWVITGKNKKIFVLSFKVTGNIDDPSILVEPMNSLSDAIKGPLLRGLGLPKELIKNPKGMIMNNP